ncbi:hypothetical protein NliqN6_5785 [Naganishia liquefaciens]|uniref:Uncharacterized protein n=1 Tax=Naganishia liquefaciens TaxID=104408 RepID=A0A8H3TYH0_9TREE|nr:hypothetical protein NliqN6_5785 [Naganishia liquefaciens]
MFMRAHPNHLIPCPSGSRSMQCARYFPGIDFALMHECFSLLLNRVLILLTEEDVAYAIQYAVIYQFLKYVDHLQTRDAAREYIVFGVTAEAEWINAHKGTYPETEKEVRVIAVDLPEDNHADL